MNSFPDSNPSPTGDQDRDEIVRLWGAPEHAPDVPPLKMLATYLNDSAALKADPLGREWLAHVESSRACQMVMQNAAFVLDSAASALPAAEVLNRLQSWASSIASNEVKAGSVVQPSALFRAWTADGVVTRWTFDPPLILVLANPRQSAYGDFLDVPVVVCSPESIWSEDSMLSDDEITITAADGEVYIAHLWLRYTVAVDQLHARVTEVGSEELQRAVTLLQAHREGCPLSLEDGAGLPLDLNDPLDRQLLNEREALYHRSFFLAANASTELLRLNAVEHAQSVFTRTESLALAAASVKGSPQETVIGEIGGKELRLVVRMDKQKADARIEDHKGNLSQKFSGAVLLDKEGKSLGVMHDATFTLGASKIKLLSSIRVPTGALFSITWPTKS